MTPNRSLRITDVPPGEAPLWVRERWVGLTLPLAYPGGSPRSVRASGVLSGPKGFFAQVAALLTGKLERHFGFVVEVQAAIDALAKTSPEAAQWWRDNTPHLLNGARHFVFPDSSGEVVESEEPL